jgi:hypothetical protein
MYGLEEKSVFKSCIVHPATFDAKEHGKQISYRRSSLATMAGKSIGCFNNLLQI